MDFDAVQFASYIGVAAFAISGAITGIRKNFDVLGIMVISIITVIGGGVIRDVLIGRMPAVLLDTTPLYVISIVVALVIFFKIHKKTDIERNFIFVISDSIGLVAFSLIGGIVAIETELDIFGIMGLSLATAVGGGIIRDILINEVPIIFKSDFYATIALLIAIMLHCLNRYDLINDINVMLVFGTGLLVRLIAYYNQWQLPRM